ncbi:MAG: hypothetical protein WCV86_01105 [Patescibacteria group bacterium]|jgi:purine nucleoside phosphorylase
MPFPKIAVIAGTGMEDVFREFGEVTDHTMDTRYHDVLRYSIVQCGDIEFVFLKRHYAFGAYCPPPDLEHERYMRPLLDTMGVNFVLATSATGGIATRIPGMELGSLIAPHDFFDLTAGKWTFDRPGHHDPLAYFRPCNDFFCPHLRHLLAVDPGITDGGLLAVAVRDRYETPAEVRILDRVFGADLLGMPTTAPEAVLCRQGEDVHYQSVCVVTDIPERQKAVSGDEVAAVMATRQEPLARSFLRVMGSLQGHDASQWTCACTGRPSVFSMVPGL